MANGGDVLQFTYAGREFPVAGDADIANILSGFNLATTPYGNGEDNTLATRRSGGMTGVKLGLSNARKDLEFLTNLQRTTRAYPCSVTWVDGITYAGQLKIDGDGLSKSSADGTATFDMRGKTWEQI